MTQDELLELIDQAAREEWTALDLSGQELVSLPMQMGQLTQLTALNLSNNQFAEFPVIVQQLTQLTTLDLSSNQLTELPIAIQQLIQLTTLDLSSNQLSELPAAIQQLTQLTTLDLSSNQLSEFPAAIQQLIQLTTLDLSSNQLSELPESISYLVNLTRLILYNNQLTTLPTSIDQLVNLNTLNLHYNRFTLLPESIGNLIHLTTLNLRHNQLIALPAAIGNLTKLTVLNLRYNQLTQLPKSIGKLVNLAVLNLRHNQLTALPKEIGLLNNLGTLDLHDNQLTDLPTEIGQLKNLTVLDLYGNQLTKLPKSTSGLTHLTMLDLGDNQLTTLPTEIGKLKHLTTLDLSGNQLESLPESIGNLTQLLTLNLSFNQLVELPNSVGELTNLATLNLACNQIRNITAESIGKLAGLIVLDLSFNKLESLPQEIGQLSNLTQLDIHGNSFTLLPLESRNNAREIVNFYRQQLEQETDHLYEAKLLILGEPGAGKTTLSKKLQDPSYQIDHDEISTEGIDIAQWSFPLENGKEFWINTWDFGGQEIYHATHQFFLTKRSLYALVVDTRKEDTDFYYWLNVVELLSNHSPLLIIKNEKQDRSRDINERELRGQFPNLKEVLVTNLATNRNLSVVSSAIKHYTKTLSHVGTPLPKTWIKVREVLEQDPRNYISLEEYLSICEQNGFTRLGDKLQLSDYLHDLGVCLHFQEDELLRKTVILKPTWGSDAVYKVLDNPHVIQNQGKFNRNDLADIWNEEKYATMQYELLKLMMKFKLCYEIPSFPGTYIAPQLLSSNQPEYTWDELDNLILRYEYEFMPKGILTRLIVETHQWIEAQSCVWKTGVVLRKDQARAEVIEHYRYHKGEIKIRVSGKRKKELLTIVNHELDKIHASYERLRYSRLIPCNCQVCQGSQASHFYRFEVLQKFLDDGQLQIQCQSSYRMVDVRGLIDEVLQGGENPLEQTVRYDRNQVFISYSHHDREWLERLQTHLKPLIRNRTVSIWDDTQITAGAETKRELQAALASANLAVLLVSPSFLASDLIAENELPPLLNAAEQEGLMIVWVLLSYCLYEETEIYRYQPAHDPTQPLSSLPRSEQDRVLVEICKTIKTSVNAR